MTNKEMYEHYLAVLKDTKNHTIVKHTLPNGKECWRVRDKNTSPIANIPISVFNKYSEKDLLTKLNQREWQLKA